GKRANYALAGPTDFTQTWVDRAPRCGRLLRRGCSGLQNKKQATSGTPKKGRGGCPCGL
ncbi:hypothetical protein BHE74_00034824, partial [Ensete ventricosum]